MFKKVLASMLSAMVLVGAMSVCSFAEQPESVTVSTVYGDVEVPYAPERICVLDLSVMDTLDTLGLGDQVVVLQWHKHYPSYLESYYNSETIISLSNGNGHGGAAAAEDENADPYEMYYGIDADIIIGTTEKITEDLYGILSQIAPTIVLPPALESDEDLYTAVRANAETIASVWGVEETLEEYVSPYDTMYTQLCEDLNGKSYVMTNGDTDLGLIQIGSVGNYYDKTAAGSENAGGESKKEEAASEENAGGESKKEDAAAEEKAEGDSKKEEAAKTEKGEDSSKSGEDAQNSGKKKKNNTENMSIFLSQFGMKDISKEVGSAASAEEISAAVEAGTSTADAASTSIDAINAANPDSVFVFNYSYGSLAEIEEAGFTIQGLEGLACPVGFFSIELGYTSGGLHAVTSMMDLLSGMFLE